MYCSSNLLLTLHSLCPLPPSFIVPYRSLVPPCPFTHNTHACPPTITMSPMYHPHPPPTQKKEEMVYVYFFLSLFPFFSRSTCPKKIPTLQGTCTPYIQPIRIIRKHVTCFFGYWTPRKKRVHRERYHYLHSCF